MKLTKSHINSGGFLLIYAAIFVVILFKVLLVPITHDEVATTVYYSSFSVWDIIQNVGDSPNNHILNTLFTKLFLFLFGIEQWVVRLPNLLAFILFAMGVWRILRTQLSANSVFFLPGALLFVASPYVLDFFGLSRGYGISLAFCVLATSFLLSGFKLLQKRDIWLAIAFGFLACYANFTLLVFWLAVVALSGLYFIVDEPKSPRNRAIALFVLIAVVFIGGSMMVFPILRLTTTEQFIYWTSNGFIDETIKPLVHYSLYDSRIFLTTNSITYFILLLLAFNFTYVVIQLVRQRFSIAVFQQPITIATLLVLLTALINIVQCWVLQTPNLNGRTALFFYPLFITALLSSKVLFSGLKSHYVKWGIGAVVVFFTAHHLITRVQMNSVKEWAYDAYTLDVIAYIEQDKGASTVQLATHWMFNPSFQFYDFAGVTPTIELLPYSKELDTVSTARYYYVYAEDIPLLEAHYTPVAQFGDKNWLLERKPN